MVIGIERFREYFKDYTGNYVIIGGTACDIIIEDAGFTPRATKDIDIILIVEALSSGFVKKFWAFIKDANYKRQEKSSDDKKYYRFINPENKDFPVQIELFSKEPELLDLDDNSHLTPIPVDDDLSNLSAILMNDDYYHYTLEHSSVEEGVNIALERRVAISNLENVDIIEIIEFVARTADEFEERYFGQDKVQ